MKLPNGEERGLLVKCFTVGILDGISVHLWQGSGLSNKLNN